MKLSFCIPTLNRPDYLKKTLLSICSDVSYSSLFEICIYNNYSDSSYESIEAQIKLLSQNKESGKVNPY